MKKIIILSACVLSMLLIPNVGFAQSELLDRFKQKAKNRVDQKVDQGMDKGLDKVEEEAKAGTQKQSENKSETIQASNTTENTSTANRDVKSFSRYDFIPGDQIVYAEDFAQDVIGEFPLKWATNNRGEAVTLEGKAGRWLRMYHTSHYVSPVIKNQAENYTVEFDMLLTFPNDGSVYPEMIIKLFNSSKEDKDGRRYLQDFSSPADVAVVIDPGEEGSSVIKLESHKNGMTDFMNEPKRLQKLGSYFGRPFHVAIWVQKQRFRLWIEGEKVYDIPQAVPPGEIFNRLDFEITSGIQEDHQMGHYLSNIKFAVGAPDMRTKLITEGKFVTTGILFDVNSDKIKAESYGVLKEMATVLKENPAVKVKVIGHTDSDGEEAKNLDLSKRRAASVKKTLSTEFGIEAGRMETDGKGELLPVDNNTTSEGKSQNRRVEFVKL
ncbi:OmpA family protein [Solitalea longa]|uniref:OmpA family protein n=1 Tax=Solitalea longa TaxID=2079460 RepID=A0A2S5A5K9_9SPHI|nr:OmpA family protein [Solitalea longa]POY37881.1 OmpA family protein [Solitalea longa]